jgi:tetratricopeptide (TPR) repeat protein
MRDVIQLGWKTLRLVVLFLFAGCGASLDAPAVAQSLPPGAEPARIEGKVCTAAGAPIADAVVQLWPSTPGAKVVEIRTDRDGRFAAQVPGAGRYKLLVAGIGFHNTVLPETDFVAGQSKHLDIVLERATTGNPANSASAGIELSDEPNFTVAGVTDWSNVGLHGSDANVRTSDSLVKDTAALMGGPGAEASSGALSEGDRHRLLGDAKEKSGDLVAAVNEYQRAVKLDPSEENYFAWGSELLLHRAGIAAVEVFQQGVKQHRKSARMHAGLGAAYYANGQFDEAAERMCEASDLNPADSQPYLFLGRMLQASTGLVGCSDETLRRFVTLQPENAQANDYYGVVLWKQGRQVAHGDEFGRAEAYFKKAIALDPKLGEVYVHLGMLYNARGQRDAALHAFEEAVAASPKLSAGHYQLSLAYRRAGETAKAEQQMALYEELKHSEDAELERERREMRQFVTTSKDRKGSERR